jgi:hypothetical protein
MGFFCKQNNDRDKLLKMDHRDTLVFQKLAYFLQKDIDRSKDFGTRLSD